MHLLSYSLVYIACMLRRFPGQFAIVVIGGMLSLVVIV
jgi:hypothetical protein